MQKVFLIKSNKKKVSIKDRFMNLKINQLHQENQ